MMKKVLKRKLLSAFLAGVLVTTSVSAVTPVKIYAEKGEGVVTAKHTFDSSYDSQNAYNGDDLGCTYTPEKTTFKVWTPLATSVVLCRYEKGNGGSAIEELPMTKGDKGVWSVTVNGDIVNTYYTYKVTVDGSTREAVDIYAKAAGVNGDRAMVVDLDKTDPANWDKNYKREKTLLSDIIVWEIHVRDFSIDVSSGVSKENRGKYKAFTENTTVNGEGRVASCVNYLKNLGVTHVQILPMYDYASVDETKVSTDLGSNYNWGYDPKNYNVPEGSYSSNPYDGNVRITELKEMIQALHDAGIKVIMDVVYNHTYDTADSNFNKIMPDYYYKVNSDMTYNNQSGCGNATRSESAMYRKFMVDSISYWADEYNLDGFRFDLMGIHDVTTMNKIRSTLDDKFGEDTIVMYGEGWTGDGSYDSRSAHKANESKLDYGIGYFNDQIRDALKGEHKFDGTIGLVQTNYFSGAYLEPGQKWPNNVFGGIMGSVGYTSGEWGMWRPFWSKSSNCCMSYVSAHDNLTLWDKLTEGFGKNYSSTDDKMKRMNKMAGGVVLVSKGGVFMQAGEEFARTKNGDDNSYSSSDSVNKIDWNRVSTYSDIQKFYKGMISIRKSFSGFRSILTRSSDNWNPTNNNITWISKDESGLTGFYETNDVQGEWDRIAVLINNATSDKTVTLTGSDKWVIIADGTNAGLEKIKETGSNVTVPGKSVMVAVPKGTFDENNVSENKPPVITCDSSYSVSAGESLEFTVKVSDSDGDNVTLTVSGVPSGAAFDTSTGTFKWEKPIAGSYKITLTASDGKDTTTKSVDITVKEKSSALKELVEEISKKNYQKKDFTEKVYTQYENALAKANSLIESNETDDEKIQKAFNDLNNAYKNISNEASAKEELADTLNKAETKLASAKKDASNYDTDAINDLEAVISDATDSMKSAHEADEYNSKKEDLEYAMKACVSLKANPTIRVKSEGWSSPAIYVWKGDGESAVKLAGEWPGTKLTEKDTEGWYVFNLPEGATGYSLIVNDGAQNTATQTTDITDIKGSVDISVTSFTGKTCTYNKQEHEIGGSDVKVDKTLLGNQITRAESVIKANPNSEKINELKTCCDNAKKINADSGATQVAVNQAVRNLKKSINDVLSGQEIETTSSDDPTKPSDDPTKPSDDPTKPSDEPTKPSDEPTKPSDEPTKPSDEPTKPSDEPTKPSDEPTKPSDEPTKPSDEPTKPSDEPTKPSDEPTKPSDEPTKPSDEPTKPSDEPVTEEPTQPVTEKLKVKSVTVNKVSGTAEIGDNVTISVKTTGGTGKIKYRFCLIKGKTSSIIKNYSSSKSCKWNFKKAGTYSIKVYVKDSEGHVATKTIKKYIVNEKLKVSSFKASPSSKKAKAGKKVKLTVKATGGTKKYQYKFAYKTSGTKKTVVINNYSSKKTVNWLPKKPGTYTLYVYVKDKTTRKVITKNINKYVVKK